MEVLKKISELIEAYRLRGSTQSVDLLLIAQDQLAGYSYLLAEMAADCKAEYNGLYFMRKVTINKATQSLIGKGLSKAAATVEAESSEDGKDALKAEIEGEADAYRYDLLLGQVNKVLSAMQQRISYLKREHENTN